MNIVLFYFIVLLTHFNYCLLYNHNINHSNECLKKVKRDCYKQNSYTEHEVENARLYLQQRFAKTNPAKSPCSSLRVRKNLRCFTRKELIEFIRVFKTLYKNGVIERLTVIHDTYWPQVHKFIEGLIWHRWLNNELEKEMIKVNPRVTLPYWEFYSDFSVPETNYIWDYLGHAGKPHNDYCVTDGLLANLTLNYPHRHCLRRQWNSDGSMPIWEPPEWATAINQMGNDIGFLLPSTRTVLNYSTIVTLPRMIKVILKMLRTWDPTTKFCGQFIMGMAFMAHFKTHMSAGGLYGDMSHSFATNDPLFWLLHAFESDLAILKWQLSDDRNLVPEDYTVGFKWDSEQQKTVNSDIDRDYLTYYNDISVKETFEVGFGELCYIYDELIKPINRIIRGEKPILPKAVHRLKSSLPKKILKLYFPKFALYPNRVTIFDYVLPEVGVCKRSQREGICEQIPVTKRFTETEIGRRNWHRFKSDLQIDITPIITQIENTYMRFIDHLNQFQYCSPYL